LQVQKDVGNKIAGNVACVSLQQQPIK